MSQINNVVATTNEGYRNSGVQIELVLHCFEELPGNPEALDFVGRLEALRDHNVMNGFRTKKRL